MKEYLFVGKGLPRKDAVTKATGAAKYCVDVELPGMLAGKILRSPLPHAKILHLETSKAARLSGVKAVLTAKDCPKVERQVERRINTFWPETRILPWDKVRYVGEEVAAVAAINEEVAEEAVALIEVDYKELPAVFDAEEALKPNAPKIHAESNIAVHYQIVRGEPDKAFQEADEIFEDKFTTQIQHQCYLEPVGSVASYDPAGKLTLWVASMDPSGLRMDLAEILQMPESKVRVINACVGGAFGGKISLYPLYPICSLLAMRAGRPVKIVNNREEEFTAALPRVPAKIQLKTAVKRDGTFLGKEARIIADSGAFIDRGHRIMATMIIAPDSLYRFPSIKADARLAYTNKTPTGAFRGFGVTQMNFALEQHLDRIAAGLNIDPVELRLKNATQPGDLTVHGWKISSCALSQCIKEAAKKIGWKEKRDKRMPNRGLGIACALYQNETRRSDGFNGSVAFVKILEDGRVQVISGESEYGQGWTTIAAQIAAEELGLPYEDMEVVSPDTDITPWSHGPWSLRVSISGGNAVRLAAADAKEQLLKIAAEMLEANPADLEVLEGKIQVKGAPEKPLAVGDVAKRAIYRRGGSAILGKGVDEPEETVRADPFLLYSNPSRAYCFSAQIIEAEVDSDTGQVKVHRVVSAHDIGQALNRACVEGQVEGMVSQGFGYALTEEVLLEDGRPINPDFIHYRIPTAPDMPSVETILVEEPEPNTVYGAKGVGMLAIIPFAPALANAIYDAVGYRADRIPITSAMVSKAMERG